MNLNMASRWVCHSCRDSLRQQRTVLARQFSTTRSAQKAAIPKFRQTSSPELDALLATIRFRVFVPSYLNKNQLKLVRQTKNKSQLENDPVYATFGDEEIRLEHLDVTKDQPPKKAFLEFLSLAKEPKDWQNLPALLEGWHHARPNMPADWYSKMITMANREGMLPIIIQCLWQVESNGFTMSAPMTRYTIFQSIRMNAKESGWEKNVTEKSLKQAQTVLELMEKPAHCGSRIVSDSDPRAEPVAIGLPLELTARRAKTQFKGKDEDGLVATYANRLITALGQQKTELSDLNVWEFMTIHKETSSKKMEALNKLIQMYLPVRNGLQLAVEILGPSMSKESREAAQKYQHQIEERFDLAMSTAQSVIGEVGSEATMVGSGFEEWQESRA